MPWIVPSTDLATDVVINVVIMVNANVDADVGAITNAWPTAADLLAMAQSLGRFGVWRHDLRTGGSHWNRQIWQYFGQLPQDQTLDFQTLMRSVHPDDRAWVVAAYEASLKQPEPCRPLRCGRRVPASSIDLAGAAGRRRATGQGLGHSNG